MAVFMLGTSLKPLKSKLIWGPLEAVATAMWVRPRDTENDFTKLFVKSNNLANLSCVTEDDPSIRIPISAFAEQTVTREGDIYRKHIIEEFEILPLSRWR